MGAVLGATTQVAAKFCKVMMPNDLDRLIFNTLMQNAQTDQLKLDADLHKRYMGR